MPWEISKSTKKKSVKANTSGIMRDVIMVIHILCCFNTSVIKVVIKKYFYIEHLNVQKYFPISDKERNFDVRSSHSHKAKE